jgi:hypothetical protein
VAHSILVIAYRYFLRSTREKSGLKTAEAASGSTLPLWISSLSGEDLSALPREEGNSQDPGPQQEERPGLGNRIVQLIL